MVALDGLDQKLWVALAMPSKGIDVDPKTLTLLDHDNDGRIRVNDILAAVEWSKATFLVPADVLASRDRVELSSIADAKIVGAAKRMLADLGNKAATSISVDDTDAIDKAFAETTLNGDGIVIVASTDDVELREVIEDAIAALGSVVDRSGKPGVDTAKATEFFAEVDTRAAWLAAGTATDLLPLGDATAAAAAAFAAVRAKLDDFFTRCRVAAYDPRGAAAMAAADTELASLATQTLSASHPQLAALPLAKIDPAGRLAVTTAINPAWAARLDTFVAAAATPIIGAKDVVTEADVRAIATKLAPYQAWMDAKPVTKVDALDVAWIDKLARPGLRKQLDELIAADAALADDYAQISAVAKTVRLQRDFGRILRNFVNFSDFYSKQDGVFQAGTLYLDARALHLCVPVADAAKHGALAMASDACLVYCDITRDGATKQIAAALTNGDVDNIFVGRNGVFYDRDGKDWDASVVKLVSNPISIRAAFWAPYKKLIKAIEDNVAKRAAAAEAASTAKLEATGAEVAVIDKKAVDEIAKPAPAPGPAAPPAPSKIDLGTIAAIGVAIGGIGTLFGALFMTLFGLGMWLPAGVLAIMLMISGPSMLLAWLKLRRRNLGPILDANGWAINSRARINVAFGAAMTELAKLPPGAKRSLDDPFADKRTPWKRYVLLILLLGTSGMWYLGKLDTYLPEPARSISVLGTNAPAYQAPKPK